MERNRRGESGSVPYRTGRFFNVDSQWFYSTRECLDHGPFITKHMAIENCNNYINSCRLVENRLNTN